MTERKSDELAFDDRGEAMYRGYRIDRIDPIDAAYLGEDACHIRKIEGEVGYWVECRNEYGTGAVSFPSVAIAVQLIDHWVDTDAAIDAAIGEFTA